jgi:hypothetical protein
VNVEFSDRDGAYFHDGAEPGELAITSPIQAPFDGMSLTVMQRMEDGTVKVHNPPKPATDAKVADAEVAVASAAGGEEGAN